MFSLLKSGANDGCSISFILERVKYVQMEDFKYLSETEETHHGGAGDTEGEIVDFQLNIPLWQVSLDSPDFA